jgi:4-hydroxy-2-oxoheptanedioate aldolase
MAVSFSERIRLKDGPLLGTVMSIPSPMVSRVAAGIFDWVMIDMEHSPLSASEMTQMVHAIANTSNGSCIPIVRIPAHTVEWVKWALDSGAGGIVIPMVNNAAEVEKIIEHAIYPPRGKRSYGPANAPFGMQLPAGDMAAYYKKAQAREIAILPMIESAEGLRNAEEIIKVDGVSGIFVGPYDLRLSMNLPGGSDGPEPSFDQALRKICDIGKRLGKPIGSMGVGELVARKRTAIGMDFLLVTLDFGALASGFESAKLVAADGVKIAKGQCGREKL